MSQRGVCSGNEHDIQTSNGYHIHVSSGVVLGATVTRPTSEGRFPVIIWNDPYRSGSDGNASPMARYFARRGYAFCYLNVRGTGNSTGASVDEYTAEETADNLDAIAWLAEQDWCDGNVGMTGASYSGFTTLQAAVENPPALKAIAPAYFTDRRYTDDCHYKGGCLRGYYDMLTYGMNMVASTALPPTPEAAGEQWSPIWQERLRKSEPYLFKWIAHQLEDDYWATGSVVGRVELITAATMLIGGWHDGYVNPPLRIFGELQSPKKLLMGPWSHTLPDKSHCGPRINYYLELLRWFDRHLKGMDNGIDDEPAVQVYEQEYEPPITDRTSIAGSWRMAGALPPPNMAPLYLATGELFNERAARDGWMSYQYLPAACLNGGLWDAGVPHCLPGLQNADEGNAINFTTPPLTEDLRIFGCASVSVYLSCDVDVMPIAVRLCEVSPSGQSVLATKGILNLTRRRGMDVAQPLETEGIFKAEFHLEATCWRFKKGNRIRISINGSDFPNVWPTPKKGTVRLHYGPECPSHVSLPVWNGGEEPAFEFEPSPCEPRATGSGGRPWRITHDVLEDTYRLQLGDGAEMGVSNRNPAVAWAKSKKVTGVSWPGSEIRSEASGVLTSNETSFIMNLDLTVYLNDEVFHQRRWSKSFKRNLL